MNVGNVLDKEIKKHKIKNETQAKIVTNSNRLVLAKELLTAIEKSVKLILEKKEKVIMAIPGGRSVKDLFELFKFSNLPWEKIHIFWVDDRLVNNDSQESNYKLAYDSFIKFLIENKKLPERNVHPFKLDESDEKKGIKDYESELKKFGNKFDISIFGVGEDGHIGALYPKHHSIFDENDFFIMMDDSPKLPKERMTGTKKLFRRSQYAFVLFIGKAKRDAYLGYLDKSKDIKDFPVKIIDDIDESFIFTDIGNN
ncbi:MAG: 6-phosphogluconolactonase [Nanoarchaeota archaeon]